MVMNRGAARLAALTAGAATVGVLGIGTAYAAGSPALGGGTANPISAVVGGTSSAVTGAAKAVTHTAKAVTGSTHKTVPGPVAKVMKTVHSTVGAAESLIGTAGLLPGDGATPSGGSTSSTSSGSTSVTKPVAATHHSTVIHRHAQSAAHRHPAASATAVVVIHLNHVAPISTARVNPTALHSVAPVTGQPAPTATATPSGPGLFYALLHPNALLPEAEHDSRLQLELLALATALAGAVAAAHLVVARRRLQNGEFAWLTGNATGSVNSTPTSWPNRVSATRRSALSV